MTAYAAASENRCDVIGSNSIGRAKSSAATLPPTPARASQPTADGPGRAATAAAGSGAAAAVTVRSPAGAPTEDPLRPQQEHKGEGEEGEEGGPALDRAAEG